MTHDRGRVLADLACAIADGGEAISDFRVIGDQGELFGPAASVPVAWRTLSEVGGGTKTAGRITAAVNSARRVAWAQAAVRHDGLPGIAVADKTMAGVTCIRLDASVVACHSDKELAEANFKGFGYHPLMAYCDNTGEPLAGMLRRGSAGSNTAAAAPRGALSYSRYSREELGGRFLGLMAHLDPKGEGDNSMPGKQWSCSGVEAMHCGTRVIWLKLDCLNPNLQAMRGVIHRKDA